MAPRQVGRVEAAAVVADLEEDVLRSSLDTNPCLARAGVLHDVGQRLTPDALTVATGSSDLPYPFAGATFPGVFTARGLRVGDHIARAKALYGTPCIREIWVYCRRSGQDGQGMLLQVKDRVITEIRVGVVLAFSNEP